MFKRFLSRPLTMSRTANSLIYGGFISLTNLCLDRLVGGISLGNLLLVALLFTLVSAMENSWVREIERKTG
jgi:hypothetical protein